MDCRSIAKCALEASHGTILWISLLQLPVLQCVQRMARALKDMQLLLDSCFALVSCLKKFSEGCTFQLTCVPKNTTVF